MQHDRVLLFGVREEVPSGHLALDGLTESDFWPLIHYMLSTVDSLRRCIGLLTAANQMRLLDRSELLLTLNTIGDVPLLHEDYVTSKRSLLL